MKSLELIAIFEKMYKEHWAYEWGAAREGCVDCSGAFVYAFKKFGQSIYHGSNSIARFYISGELRKAADAKPGWAVFKWREAGDDIHAKFNDGLGDFYHIGLCALDGKNVLNAKGSATGFSQDPLSKWAYAAPLKGVDYTDEEEDEPVNVLYRAVVNTAKDDLRVREAPKTGKIIGHAPRGKVVDVLAEGTDGWPRIRYGELVGYASDAYLVRVNEVVTQPVEDGGPTGEEGYTVTLPLADARKIYAALGDAYRALGAVMEVD